MIPLRNHDIFETLNKIKEMRTCIPSFSQSMYNQRTVTCQNEADSSLAAEERILILSVIIKVQRQCKFQRTDLCDYKMKL